MRGLVLAAAAALALGACSPQAATPEAEAKSAGGAAFDSAAGGADAEAAPKVDGKPMWSANRSQTAEENAQEAFERNGPDFGSKDMNAYVRKAHDFTSSPPPGADSLKRSNGDTLFYDARSNTFAVMTKDGAPRTMFKPKEGAAYWAKQKDTEAARKAKSG